MYYLIATLTVSLAIFIDASIHPRSVTYLELSRLMTQNVPIHIFQLHLQPPVLDERLVRPELASSATNTLIDTSHALNGLLRDLKSCLHEFKRGHRSHHVFHDAIVVAQSLLDDASSILSVLEDHYQLIRSEYYERSDSAAEAVRGMNNIELEYENEYKFWSLPAFFSSEEALIKARQAANAARLGVVAVEDELFSLREITQVIPEIKYHLERLIIVSFEGTIRDNCPVCVIKAREIVLLVQDLWSQSLAQARTRRTKVCWPVPMGFARTVLTFLSKLMDESVVPALLLSIVLDSTMSNFAQAHGNGYLNTDNSTVMFPRISATSRRCCNQGTVELHKCPLGFITTVGLGDWGSLYRIVHVYFFRWPVTAYTHGITKVSLSPYGRL